MKLKFDVITNDKQFIRNSSLTRIQNRQQIDNGHKDVAWTLGSIEVKIKGSIRYLWIE